MALGYREIAYAHAPAETEALDRRAAEWGEAWPAGVVTVGEDDLVTASEAEAQLGVSASTVRQWSTRGHLEAVDSGPSRYRVRDVRALVAEMRRRRR